MSQSVTLRDLDRVADRIRLHRQVDKNPVVVVEGPSDASLLRRSFSREWALFPAGTRSAALDAARSLHAWKMDRIVCIVDRDFDEEVAKNEAVGIPILAYANADVEAMLSQGGGFRDLIEELGSIEKLSRFGGLRKLEEQLHEAVKPVAVLRRANVENNWGLNFDAVDLAAKVDSRTLALKLQPYCAALSATVANSPSQGLLLKYATGAESVNFTPSCPRGSSPYFRGRDFLAIAGVALRSVIGSCARNATEAEHLAKVLRLAATALLYHSNWGQELVATLGSDVHPPA